MLSLNDIKHILAEIRYKDWNFDVIQGPNTAYDWPSVSPMLRVRFTDPETGVTQKGRKWVLSYHMTKSEVVLTALKAVLTAEEHEARELFRYRGSKIFNPHINVDKLVELTKKLENLDVRNEPVAL
jgi:hypothetical protein